MTKKLQIAKCLIIFGCILSISNYGVDLINFYTFEDKTSIAIEESEGSEQKEKEGSENEDFKEKEKISPDYEDRASALANSKVCFCTDLHAHNSSVHLEHNTPPPEFS